MTDSEISALICMGSVALILMYVAFASFSTPSYEKLELHDDQKIEDSDA